MVYRIFGIDQASNKLSTFKLPAGQVHCVAQFQTEYVAVSCDSGVEIFNVLAECHVRTIQGQGIFQLAIPVYPQGGEYLGDDVVAQEMFVMYKYGSFQKLGLVCERTPSDQYPAGALETRQEEEEKKDEEGSM